MTAIAELSSADHQALLAKVREEFAAFKAQGHKLDMTRGKPSPEQLDLSNGMLALPGNGDFHTEANEDGRNYGGLQGIAEARTLFAPVLGAPADQVVIGDNSSLAMMHDSIIWALLKGVPGSVKPWSKESEISFLCPVPGYDRHFFILEEYGIKMIPVPLTGQGPDMDLVEKYVADPSVKGMWAVPKYANPSGEIYSEETTKRLAAMKTGAPDFRIFWDNAYALHHLTNVKHEVANILDACAAAGNPDRAFVYASTSKMTLAGAGLAFFASSPANVKWYLGRAGKRTIGPDKLNQIRHVRFLKSIDGLHNLMGEHAKLIAPKFAAVEEALSKRLTGTGLATWTKPEGGYFVSLDTNKGLATNVVTLAKEAGLALTPAGSTWPLGQDPDDSNLRLAPTFPSLKSVQIAAEGIALCVLLAGLEKRASA